MSSASDGSGQVQKKEDLEQSARAALLDGRMVLPAMTTLFAFQLSVSFTDAFTKTLPAGMRAMHLVAVALVAIAMVIVIAPAAYQRLAEKEIVTKWFVRFTSHMVMAAMVPLMLAVALDLHLVAWQVTGGSSLGAVLGAVLVVSAASLWFVFPLVRRRKVPAPAS